MVDKTSSETEQFDVKEVVSSVEAASGLLTHASESFTNVAPIFKAIRLATAYNSLAGRLSRLGEKLCDEHAGDFEQYGRDFSDLFTRFAAEMGADVGGGEQ